MTPRQMIDALRLENAVLQERVAGLERELARINSLADKLAERPDPDAASPVAGRFAQLAAQVAANVDLVPPPPEPLVKEATFEPKIVWISPEPLPPPKPPLAGFVTSETLADEQR